MEKIKNLFKNIKVENIENKIDTLLKVTLVIECSILFISELLKKINKDH